jgi:hypothetical protein
MKVPGYKAQNLVELFASETYAVPDAIQCQLEIVPFWKTKALVEEFKPDILGDGIKIKTTPYVGMCSIIIFFGCVLPYATFVPREGPNCPTILLAYVNIPYTTFVPRE